MRGAPADAESHSVDTLARPQMTSDKSYIYMSFTYSKSCSVEKPIDALGLRQVIVFLPLRRTCASSNLVIALKI